MTKSTPSSKLYRIAYEAYSEFTININRCSNLKEVGKTSQRHLKYLFNFHIIRLVIEQNDRFLFFSINKNKISYGFKRETELMDFEKELYQNGIPIRTAEIPDQYIDGFIDRSELVNPSLWAWGLDKNNRKILVSLLADDNLPFSYGDIRILKLTVDAFEEKFHEIYLKEQLDRKNSSLSKVIETIQSQNSKIGKILNEQKQTIEAGSMKIDSQNQKLLGISSMNAHDVREPLSRIQGIVQLFDVSDEKTCREELIPMLKTSAVEIDDTLKKVIEMATKELSELNTKA
ncbi:hypothetical protein [Christiangramia salexigens]|uniref:Signal transduction histidine kinase dimerisation/phosphoacceptor domain-containing protein n=1 Tax=Christiangramia salexigens TaxID=1913577 RepID=A0A1L3J4A0_9FLAO|nr:hypothetical protein [Christiangramia salexigens]APG59930.1 hypothetical protein LPB144_05680 [Christiangramia salexigens]